MTTIHNFGSVESLEVYTDGLQRAINIILDAEVEKDESGNSYKSRILEFLEDTISVFNTMLEHKIDNRIVIEEEDDSEQET